MRKLAVVVAGTLALSFPFALAQAENWVKVGTNEVVGFDACLDSDSIRRDADGLTHYRTQFCQSFSKEAPNPIWQSAVDCAQDMSAEKIKLRRLINGKWESKDEYSSSLAGQEAKYVCQK